MLGGRCVAAAEGRHRREDGDELGLDVGGERREVARVDAAEVIIERTEEQ
jgi:hypothetical protein